MNRKFSSNPITLKKGNEIVDILELDLDFEDNDFILDICSMNGDNLFYGKVNSDTFISLDVSLCNIITRYINPVTKETVEDKIINIGKEFNIDETERLKKQRVLSEKEFYENLIIEVKDKMDEPGGTQKEVEHHTLMLKMCTMDDNARSYVENKIRQIIFNHDELTEEQINNYTKKIYANFYGMGILQEIDDDIDVGEIMVNGFIHPKFRCDIYYVKNGEKIKYNKTFENLDELINVYSRAISFAKKELNNVENALIEATRANRDRVNIIIPDASESYVLNIRKFGNFVPDLQNMKNYGTVDTFIDNLMKILVFGKANIGIGGEMGTGKTTFINYLLSYTKPIERKVVIASVSETDVERVLKDHDVVILNVNDEKGFSFVKLIRASLRTTASRVIIPESRGDEFKQVYEANLKTKGNMFTAHALDDYSFLDMCVDMYNGDNSNSNIKNVRDKIAKSVDIVIIMRKVGNSIRIKSISEVYLNEKKDFEKMNLLYYWESDKEDSTKGRYVRTNNRISDTFKQRLNEYGVPMSELQDL
ncbi:MAG: hypothetical protein K0R54_665 [Clostridiaceae bacterium]|jgi:pilus assembly protein CpaF|nr:hypothetical protein [Clostridiaceae bacterium]